MLMRYANGKWSNVQDCSVLQGDDKVIFYEATHNSLSLFAIVGTPEVLDAVDTAVKEPIVAEKVAKPEQKGWKVALWALLALILLGLFLAPLYFQPQQEDVVPTGDIENISNDINEVTDAVAGIDTTEMSGIPPQSWSANTQLRLNLSKYFIDPDNNDTLKFTNTQVQNINIVYEGSVAVLMPKTDWTGEGIVIFTATDNSNASVESNPVKLTVTEQEIKPEWLVQEYGTYVLLALVFLVLLLIGSSLFKRGEEPKN